MLCSAQLSFRPNPFLGPSKALRRIARPAGHGGAAWNHAVLPKGFPCFSSILRNRVRNNWAIRLRIGGGKNHGKRATMDSIRLTTRAATATSDMYSTYLVASYDHRVTISRHKLPKAESAFGVSAFRV